MNSLPAAFAATTQSLPLDELGPAGRAAAEAVAVQGYEVHAGLTAEFAAAIAAMAREPGIRAYCPNDARERFSDPAAAATWLTKGRAVFLLLKQAEDGALALAGYGWTGPATSPHVPAGRTTFALRVGEAGQGRGLAAPFARLILAGSAALYGLDDVWLETWASNGAAVHVYHKVGFVTVKELPAERPLPDGGTAADMRVYMSLSNDQLTGTA